MSFILANCVNLALLGDVLSFVERDSDDNFVFTDNSLDAELVRHVFVALRTVFDELTCDDLTESESVALAAVQTAVRLVDVSLTADNIEYLLSDALSAVHRQVAENRQSLLVSDCSQFLEYFLYLVQFASSKSQTPLSDSTFVINLFELYEFFNQSAADYSVHVVMIRSALKFNVRLLTIHNELETLIPDNSPIEKMLLALLETS